MISDQLNKAIQRQGTWHSYDVQYERLKVFSPWTIGGFGLAVCLGLVLVYPHKTLEEQLAGDSVAKPDRLTVEYLKVFLKAEPAANALRFSLVKQLMGLGSFEEARDALSPLHTQADAVIRTKAAWEELSIREHEAHAEQPGTTAHEARITSVRGQLRALLDMQQNADALLLLARKALAAGDSGSAAAAFQQLAHRPEKFTAQVYADAARTTLGIGDYRTSAAFYFKAMALSGTLEERRDYFIEALRTLQGGNLVDEAIAAADAYLGPLGNDTRTLIFLTRLAQAANRPAAAQRYARRMLRMSMMNPSRSRTEWVRQYQTPLQYVIAQWETENAPLAFQHVAANDLPDANLGEPRLAFDEEAYRLGYDVFLANGNVAEARQLAQSAVRQRPGAPAWRKRLAEASESSAVPVLALENWLAYARLTGDESGWDATLRLSQGLGDLEKLREALQHKAAREPGNDEWTDRLLISYEASGEPERALDLLRSRLDSGSRTDQNSRRRHLERYAALAERAGRDADSLDALRLMQREFGSDSAIALRIASKLYKQGKLVESFAALQQATPVAAVGDIEFWRNYAEVARLLQNDDASETGYRKLIESDGQRIGDIENLAALLDTAQPEAAAMLMEYGYAKFGQPRFLMQALTLHVRMADWKRAQQLLSGLSSERRMSLQEDPDFLSTRAAIRQASGDLSGAARDVQAGLVLRPDSMEMRAALIWILIAARDAAALKARLAAWTGDAETNGILWGPFAAANMALSRPDVALHWFRKSGFPKDDYLWLMSYAECLEANAQPDLAWRIRRKVWSDLRDPAVLKNIDPAQWRSLRDRLAAVSSLFVGGDGAQQIMQALLRSEISAVRAEMPAAAVPADGKELLARLDGIAQTPPLPAGVQGEAGRWFPPSGGTRPQDDARLTATARELALAYAVNRESHDLARAWLATRFANQLAKPLWGELTLLLAANDTSRLNQLLDDLPDWLPMLDRIEAAKQAGRPALAQTLAFDQMTRMPHDDALHLRLANLTAVDAPAFRADASRLKQGSLDIERTSVEGSITVANGLFLGLFRTKRTQESNDTQQLRNIPRTDDDVGITLRRPLHGGFLSFTVQHRKSAEDTTGARLDYRFSPWQSIVVSGNAGLRQRANESALLRIGGMRSGVEANIDYAFASREYLRTGLSWQRYESQADTTLGRGLNLNAEIGTHLRIDYPNLTLRAFGYRGRYRDSRRYDEQIARLAPLAADPMTFRYVPGDAGAAGIALGVGTIVENSYSRAWRPFAEAGLTYNRSTGRSVDLRGGIAGSVAGGDVLTLRAQQIGGTATNPQGLKEIGLQYTWLY